MELEARHAHAEDGAGALSLTPRPPLRLRPRARLALGGVRGRDSPDTTRVLDSVTARVVLLAEPAD